MEEEKSSNIINVNMGQNPASAASERYELKMATFKNVKPERFLMLLNNFKTEFDGTGTTSAEVKTNYLCMMLRVESQ